MWEGLLDLDCRLDRVAYSALQDAESTLKNVHDGIIGAFPSIDRLIVMDSRYEICWSIVFSVLFQSALSLNGIVPFPSQSFSLLGFVHHLKKLDMAGREQIESSVDIYHSLPISGPFPSHQFLKAMLLILYRLMVRGGLIGTGPAPDLQTRSQTGVVTRKIFDSLFHVFAQFLSFLLAA